MSNDQPRMMRAMVLESFGGPDAFVERRIPVPATDAHEVLLRVECAGVGEWDAFEREGGYAQMLGVQPRFPYVLGSEGAGTVVAVGADVRDVRVGDRVSAVGFLNPKGGFYAEYAAVDAALVSPIPKGLTAAQASVLGGVGLTALRGLEDTLKIRPGETVLVFGASGGVGHVAVQLANRLGARVLAVASGDDGVALVKQLGAEAAVDGKKDGVVAAMRAFAPDGLEAALLTSGGPVAEQALKAVRDGGGVAWPNGVQPEPSVRAELRALPYNGEPDRDILDRLLRLVEAGPFTVHVARELALTDAAEAQRAAARHHLGKLVLRIA